MVTWETQGVYIFSVSEVMDLTHSIPTSLGIAASAIKGSDRIHWEKVTLELLKSAYHLSCHAYGSGHYSCAKTAQSPEGGSIIWWP